MFTFAKITNQTCVWNTEETDKLIDIIKKYPVMWKTDHHHYGKRGTRDASMRKVANEFGSRGMSL